MINEAALIKSVGARVKALRHAAGLTQEQMALRIGCNLRNYQRFEQGENLTLRTLAWLASVLGVTPARLLEGADEPRVAA